MILFGVFVWVFLKDFLGLVARNKFINLWIEKMQDFYFLIVFYYDFFFSFEFLWGKDDIWGEVPSLVDPHVTCHASLHLLINICSRCNGPRLWTLWKDFLFFILDAYCCAYVWILMFCFQLFMIFFCNCRHDYCTP